MSDAQLEILASRAGLAVDWIDANGRAQKVAPAVLRNVLIGLGHPAGTAQEIDAKLAGSLLRSAAGEDINLVMAMGANKVAHVFDDPGNVNLHLPEHLDRLARVLQRNVGRRGYNDCCRQGNGLDKR